MPTQGILIVEDDVDLRGVLEEMLKEETTHQIFVASDGEEALGILREITPDLFLLDYRLPGSMNGVDLIAYIRADKRYQSTPIVLMSAGTLWMRELRDVCYLAKPFELDEFLQVVACCLIKHIIL
jgi:DNA-binding response OmpR family regulator